METRDFGDDEIQFLRTYAMILGPVIHRLHLLEERTEVRDRLRSSEARHRLLIESWAQAVWEVDAAGVVVADSPSWRAYTGQTLEEWLGYGWLNAIHPDDRAYIERQWRDAVAATRNVNAEYRLRAPDGGWRWTNIRAAPVLDDKGTVRKWAGMNIDIDGRKRAEDALATSERRLQLALSTTGLAAYEWDLVTDRVVGDERFNELTGLGEPSTGERILTAAVHPDDREWLEADLTGAMEGTSTGRFVFEHRLAKSGPRGERWVLSNGQVSFAGSSDERRAVRVLGTLFDISDRKHAEAETLEREQRQAFLLKLADVLRSLANPADLQGETTRLLREQLNAGWCYYVDWDLDRKHGLVLRDSTMEGLPSLAGAHDVSDAPEFLQLLAEGSVRAVRDYANYEQLPTRIRQKFTALGFRSMMLAPLVKEGRLIATLLIGDTEVRDWSAGEASLLVEVAERTWAAVERARVEAALRDSKARLTTAFESVPVGVAVIDVAGNVVISNAEYRRFLPSGLMPSRNPEIAAQWKGWDAQGHPLGTEDFPGARAMRGENVVPGQEMIFTDENGRETWTSVAVATTRDEHGRVTGGVSVISDIDVAKRSGEALRRSEERFRQFGEASQDVLWIRDAETLQWEYLTPAFEGIYGVSREEALAGNNYRSWLELIVPEDRPHALESVWRVQAGEQVAFEFRIRRPADGAIRWLRNTDFPIRNEAGEIALIGSIGHDFTALHETGLRLQALVDGIPQLVWRAGAPGLWTWASPQWTVFTGQQEADSHGWGWLEPLHPDDRNVARAAWSQAVGLGKLEIEYRIGGRAGAYRWFQTRAVPVRDKGGEIVEWIGTSTDIHDLRLLQDRQHVMVQELQHRTRNLITVVSALSKQTLKNAASLSDFDHRFEDRLSALSRVQGLLSHLSAGKRVTFDELLGSELTALGAPDDKVTLDGPKGVPLRSATVQTFSLALHELATNALKYGALAAPEGHLTVRWDVTHSDRDGLRLQVDWRETGVALTHVGDRPRGGGYGRELIEHALPYQLDADTTYELEADGVHCTIDVPASTVGTELD